VGEGEGEKEREKEANEAKQQTEKANTQTAQKYSPHFGAVCVAHFPFGTHTEKEKGGHKTRGYRGW